MKQKRLIIFDFDGTIADTMRLGIMISNQLAGKYGFKTINEEELNAYRNQKTLDALKSAGINPILLPLIARDFKSQLNKKIRSLNPIEGIKPVIKELGKAGWKLAIVTSNSKKNVNTFLENHSLLEEFEFIKTRKNLFKKSKVLKSIPRKTGFEFKQIVYVGDETRDIEAAKKIGITVAAVTWGMHSKEILSACNPDFLIDTPRDLLGLFLN